MAQITPQQVQLASGEVLAPIGLGRATPAPPWRTKRAVWAVLAVALVGLVAGVAAKSSPAPTAAPTSSPTSSPTPHTPSPTPSPTPPPPTYWCMFGCPSGSDLAAAVSVAADGAEFVLPGRGVITWASQVTCAGKTLTLTGAGKGATILDAGGARKFFTLINGCTLVLRKLSMRNGKAGYYGGAISGQGSTLHASDVEFKDNSAYFVRYSRATARHRPAARARARRRRRRRSHAPTHPTTRSPFLLTPHPLAQPRAARCGCMAPLPSRAATSLRIPLLTRCVLPLRVRPAARPRPRA
jgi:hypothetical protein